MMFTNRTLARGAERVLWTWQSSEMLLARSFLSTIHQCIGENKYDLKVVKEHTDLDVFLDEPTRLVRGKQFNMTRLGAESMAAWANVAAREEMEEVESETPPLPAQFAKHLLGFVALGSAAKPLGWSFDLSINPVLPILDSGQIPKLEDVSQQR